MNHAFWRMALLSGLVSMSTVVGAEEAATAEIPQEWKPTTLSEKTLATIQKSVESYHRCLDAETKKHVKDPEDSRKLTDEILTACDAKLSPIKPAFQSEKVPDALSERYLQRKRSQAAQQIVQVVMGAHALRYRETHP
jgi:prophage DNA circulation protein